MQLRSHEIDGIRGWAALSVLFFHFFQEVFGVLFPAFHHSIFNFVLNGHLMVLIFFVLSGDALSNSFFKTSTTTTTIRIALARYFRLTFLIAVSCIVSYFFMLFHLNHNLETASLVHREDWLGMFLNFEPSFPGVIKYILYGVYFEHNVSTSYNPFLWTMSIELLGSLLVFINIFIFSATHPRVQVLILIVQACFFWLFGSYLSLFIFGMLLGWIRQTGFFHRMHLSKYNFAIFIFFLLLAIWFFSFHIHSISHLFEIITNGYIKMESVLFLFAGLFVFLVYINLRLIQFFSNNISRFFGKISFPLYVLQFNILVSISAGGILYMNELGCINSYFILIIPSLSIVVTIIVAYVFELIERQFLKVLNHIIITKVLKIDEATLN